MGYELNKLMERYGVSTPGRVAYTGPAAPVVPTQPTPLAKDATKEQKETYKKAEEAYKAYTQDPSAFNDLTRRYGLAQKEYDQYSGDYLSRISGTPMYGEAQYQTGLKSSPKPVTYNDRVAAPTYGAVPATLAGKQPTDLAAYYDRLLSSGYTDADIRAAAEKSFGSAVNTLWTPYVSRSDSPDFVGTVLGNTPTVLVPNANVPTVPTVDTLVIKSHGGAVHDMAEKYNVGGAVRKFQFGGNEGEPDDTAEMTLLAMERDRRDSQRSPEMGGRFPKYQTNTDAGERFLNKTKSDVLQTIPSAMSSVAARPLTVPESKSTPVSPAANDLMSMLNRYISTESEYGPELKSARKRLTAESSAFTDLLQKAMKSEDTKPDKAEMYFRLAAAFGAPTKTGAFSENLAMAGKELGDYAKDIRTAKRADRALQLQLGLEAQKARMQAAREELTSLRTLTAEEMKDKRAIVAEYLKSGRPQSEAGKAAIDAGLKQGTPEFTEFVNNYIDDKIRSGNIFKEAMVAVAQGNLGATQTRVDIAKQAEKRQQEAEQRQQKAAGKLTPKEVDLKAQAETSLTTIDNALADLNKAFVLNKDSFDSSLKDRATLTILEQTGSKDPKVLNTKELLNLLKSSMISSASEKLKGVLSDSDIKLLQSIAGLDAASREERASIMKNAYRALKAGRTAQQKRLDEITRGLYRETTPATAGETE